MYTPNPADLPKQLPKESDYRTDTCNRNETCYRTESDERADTEERTDTNRTNREQANEGE